mgnify:CR=1 FL=1
MQTSEVIARRRNELGLTQAELAQRIGTDPRNIRRYESGESVPTLGVAQNIAKALGITLDELAGGGPTFGGLWWSSWEGLTPQTLTGRVNFTHHGRTVDINPATITHDDPAHPEGLQWRSSLLVDGDDLLGWFDLHSPDVSARGTLQLRRCGATITGTWVKVSLRTGMSTGSIGLGRTREAAAEALAVRTGSTSSSPASAEGRITSEETLTHQVEEPG